MISYDIQSKIEGKELKSSSLRVYPYCSPPKEIDNTIFYSTKIKVNAEIEISKILNKNPVIFKDPTIVKIDIKDTLRGDIIIINHIENKLNKTVSNRTGRHKAQYCKFKKHAGAFIDRKKSEIFKNILEYDKEKKKKLEKKS